MSSWSHLLNQTIYYKTATGYSDGTITYSDATSCQAAYEDVSKTINTGNGQEILVNTEIISEVEIPEEARVWLTNETTDISKSRMVKSTRKFYNKITGDTMYLSWL